MPYFKLLPHMEVGKRFQTYKSTDILSTLYVEMLYLVVLFFVNQPGRFGYWVA